MAASRIEISNELWQDIDNLDEDDLVAFDDCFGNEFFDMVASSHSEVSNSDDNDLNMENFEAQIERESRKRLNMPALKKSTKRRKSSHFSYELENFNMRGDTSLSSVSTDARSVGSASVRSTQLAFMTPMELDQQLNQSMSRLAFSMRRSEFSREQVIKNSSKETGTAAPFASSNFLEGGRNSGVTSAVYPGSSQIRSYINCVGRFI